MKTIKKIILAITLALPLVGSAQEIASVTKETRGFYGGAYSESNNGKPIKPFSMTTTDGKKINSGDLKGKVVVLDFWSTWCAPCRDLTKQLNDSLAEYNGDKFLMIGVNYMESVKKGNPLKYWQEKGYKFPMTINNDAYGKSIGAGNPTIIVIDQEGIIRGRFDSYTDVASTEIKTLVWALMEKPEISVEEAVMAGRNKEYVKAVYLADQVMKKDTVQGRELAGEKFSALLHISEWTAVEYIKQVIKESKKEELEQNLTNAAISIAQTDGIQSGKIYLYAAELFEKLIVDYKLGENMVVQDQMGRCYFKAGEKQKALAAAVKSLSIAEKDNEAPETLKYLKGVLDNYKKS
ncbi:TlpA disulfide reductase family protein [Flavobacterium sp. DGU38]|uniref:TlpA disulfide reductase family protein n=1 Tax=Flavobacterium calami TaxID=3139144 RepID=A0ABU9IPH6_9FLAO